MSKQTKIIVFTILVSVLTISIIIYRYEFLLKEIKKQQGLGSAKGGTSMKQYTASEIISLIKSSKEFIGDSVIIFDNGNISSSNGKFQGTLQAVVDSEDNMDLVISNMNSNRLPLEYNIYILAATYYRQQYAEEFKSNKTK